MDRKISEDDHRKKGAETRKSKLVRELYKPAGVRGAEDSARGDNAYVASTEFLLQFTNQTSLDLVVLGKQLVWHEDNDCGSSPWNFHLRA